MVLRAVVPESLFWGSLLVGLVAIPLFLSGEAQGPDGITVLLAAAYLLGLAGFGFGSSLLLAAYSGDGMHPSSILVAAVGALASGVLTVLVAADLASGLRVFAFSVLLVAGAGIAAAPRAWQHARADRAVIVPDGGKTGQDAGRQGP